MSILDNIKMGPKLIGAFLLVAAISAIVGGVGIVNIKAIDEADTKLYEKVTVPLGEMGDMMQLFQRQRVNVRDAMMTGDAERFGKRIKEIDDQLTKVEESFQKTLLTEKGKAIYKTYKDTSNKYDGVTGRVLALIQTGKSREAEALMRGEGAKDQTAVNEALDVMQDEDHAVARW